MLETGGEKRSWEQRGGVMGRHQDCSGRAGLEVGFVMWLLLWGVLSSGDDQ